MSLTELPVLRECLIVDGDPQPLPASAPYLRAGMSAGRHARVLARYPASQPRYLEVELDGLRTLTIPVEVASAVKVRPLGSEIPPSTVS